ncbi:16S rRNA (cytosine(1402)-N(4))-methyltransferase RsmH [Candidatus Providencia siddallii]|uniref:Ribosomal RNA small subunit methyltransferase H n=1 Tax=Candidatus Providencia siddallii TaxID=1715285 RepID=A0ABP1CDV4_9GAMM
MIKKQYKHIAVLQEEAINGLNIKPNGIYIDGTFGTGGHSKLILNKLNKNGRLIVIDRDPEAIKIAKSIKDRRLVIKQGLFSDIINYIKKKELIGKINGILLDFGISSSQLDNPERGFSFTFDGPLDMRMDQTKGQTASQWLMNANVNDIIFVLKTFGEERLCKRIAKAIIEHKNNPKKKPLTRTKHLTNLILKTIPKYTKKHPATRTFQAIRIYINNELEEIKQMLNGTLNILAPQGRISIISFHSLEDRLVKHFIRKNSKLLNIPINIPLTKFQIEQLSLKTIQLRDLGKIKPSYKEIKNNPRSRSSILRLAEKINNGYKKI